MKSKKKIESRIDKVEERKERGRGRLWVDIYAKVDSSCASDHAWYPIIITLPIRVLYPHFTLN